MRIRSILVGFGEIRFNADRFVTVGERFLELAESGVGKRAIAVGFCEVGFDSDRITVVCNRLIELFQFEVCLTALVIGLGVVWLEPNRFGVIRDGFVILLRVCFAAGLVKEIGDVCTGWRLAGRLPGCLSRTSWLGSRFRARGLGGGLDDRDGRGRSYRRPRKVPTGEHDSAYRQD